MGEARLLAEEIIRAEYAPRSGGVEHESWEGALADLAQTGDLRPDSVRDYRTAVGAVRALFPSLVGPVAVTPAVAARFPHLCLATPFRRGKGDGAAT